MIWDFVRQQRGRLWLEFLAALRSGAEPGRVLVGTLEAPWATELLSRRLWRTQLPRSPGYYDG